MTAPLSGKALVAELTNRSRPTTLAWLAVAVLLCIASAATIRTGGGFAAAALLIAGAIVVVCARRAAAGHDARFVLASVGLAFALRACLAASLDVALTERGRNGALFLDDASYLRIAAQLADSWRNSGPPVEIDPTQGGNYVRLAGTIFFAFGPNAIVLKLLNTVFGTLAGLLVYRTMSNLGLPGARIALVLTLFFPSLVLWSALALKDAYVLFFAIAPIWLMTEFKRTGRLFPWFPLILVSLLAIENVRVYVFVILLLAWPLSVPFLVGRVGWVKPTGVAAAVAALLLAVTPALSYLNPNIVTASTYIRQAMAAGARSAFVEPLPVVRGDPGDRFVVNVANRTHAPAAAIRTIEVRPGDNLVVEGSGTVRPNEVPVRPGDVIVLATPSLRPGSPTSTPGGTSAPTDAPAAVLLSDTARNVVGGPSPSQPPQGSSESGQATLGGMLEALRHLPVGAFHLVTAPIPLTSAALIDIATIPEMLAWYVCQILALYGFVMLARRKRLDLAYAVMALAGIALTISLFEGNTGTLLRHRAMLIPFVAMLAAVGAEQLFRQGRYRPSRRSG